MQPKTLSEQKPEADVLSVGLPALFHAARWKDSEEAGIIRLCQTLILLTIAKNLKLMSELPIPVGMLHLSVAIFEMTGRK